MEAAAAVRRLSGDEAVRSSLSSGPAAARVYYISIYTYIIFYIHT